MRARLPWILAGLAGLVAAAALGLAASRLTEPPVGLSGEPVSAGEALAPGRTTATTPRRAVTTPARRRTRPTRTTTTPAVAPAPAPVPAARVPAARVPAPTAVPTTPSDDHSGSGGGDDNGGGGKGRDHPEDD